MLKLHERLESLNKKLGEAKTDEERKAIQDEITEIIADAEKFDKANEQNIQDNIKYRNKNKELEGKLESIKPGDGDDDPNKGGDPNKKPEGDEKFTALEKMIHDLNEKLEKQDQEKLESQKLEARKSLVESTMKEAGVDPFYFKMIDGDDEESIKASVTAVKQEITDKGLAGMGSPTKSAGLKQGEAGENQIAEYAKAKTQETSGTIGKPLQTK